MLQIKVSNNECGEREECVANDRRGKCHDVRKEINNSCRCSSRSSIKKEETRG